MKASGGKLSRGQLLRCRVRYFSDGVAIGSKDFVNEVFEQHRAHFGPKRKEGAKPMRQFAKRGRDGALCSLRGLRIGAVESRP